MMTFAIAIILSAMLLAVAMFDITKFIIPNWLNFAFIALYPIFLIATPQEIEWWWSLAAMGCFFGVGLLIFQLNIMGGGDVKLLIALSLWIGWQGQTLMQFGLLVSIVGGVLALFLIVARLIAAKSGKTNLPRVLEKNAPIPYGVAISYAFATLMWKNQILGLVI